jgi:hypothetical protein
MGDARQISTSVPTLMHYALVVLAISEGRSVSAVIKDFIDEGLQRRAREEAAKKRKAGRVG